MLTQGLRLLPRFILAVPILAISALPGHSQAPAAAAAFAHQSEITAEIQEVLGGSKRGVNGGSLDQKVASPSPQAAAPAAQIGFNYFRPSYCYVDVSGTPLDVVVFTDGTYIYTTVAAGFAELSSACPSATTVAVHVTAINGSNFSWDSFYVLHN